jgi:hypothetical protein
MRGRSLVAPLGLCCAVGTATCSSDAGTSPQGNAGIITFNILPSTTTDADGYQVDTLAVAVDTTFRSINGSVVFSTNAGVFSNNTATITVPIDSLGMARAFLRAPVDSAIAYATAVTGGKLETRIITYVPALPGWLNVTASSVFVDPKLGATSDVTVAPMRRVGTTSPGGVVHFELALPAGSEVSAKLNVDSVAANVSATTRLVLLTTDTGNVFVRTTYTRNKQIVVKDSVLVHVAKTQ